MLFMLVVFVFFKQKTAYEMRISDWSSDVCSSDLRAHADFVFLEGFENGRVQRRQLQHAADIGGGDAERCCNIVNVFAAVDDRPIGGDGIGRRSEERRVGKEGVSPCRSRWSRYH